MLPVSVKHIVDELPAINLSELSVVDFERRIDTKYVFGGHLLLPFLERIKDHVVVLEISKQRSFNYKNIYFDTSDFEYFRRHHAGHLNRIKVRARQYGEGGPSVFEIKTKTNKNLTEKVRIPIENLDQIQTEVSQQFLMDHLNYGFEQLPQHTGVNYQRITMANREMTEKFTLDLQLEANNGGQGKPFVNLFIAEVKQQKFTYNSVFIKNLKELKIRPRGFSKYCNAVLRYNPELKSNRFKPISRAVHKIELEDGIIT